MSGVEKFRTRILKVEATRFADVGTARAICRWCNDGLEPQESVIFEYEQVNGNLQYGYLDTANGTVKVDPMDYVVKEPGGPFFTMTTGDFERWFQFIPEETT